MQRFSLLLLLLLAALPARAVIIASGDGAGNTSPPADDPGWAYVGQRGGASAVYLGNRWVLTATHAGAGDVVLGGRVHRALPDSTIRLQNEDLSLSDLVLFRLAEEPGLPPLRIASETPERSTSLVLIGSGRNRGVPSCWYGRCGWLWGAGRALRWGTNEVSNPAFELRLGGVLVHSFLTDFSELGTPYESHAADGDSGGAAFVKRGDVWELAGLIVAVGPVFQPGELAIFGSVTFFADLARYHEQIARLVTPPACSDGLDNVGNLRADYPADKGCSGPDDLTEGSGPIELALAPQDLGPVTLGETRSAVLALTNVGSEAVVIDKITLSSSTGFTLAGAPALPFRLAPQSEDPASVAELAVRFKLSVVRSASAPITISTTEAGVPDVRLMVRASTVWATPERFGLEALQVENATSAGKAQLRMEGGTIALAPGQSFDPIRDAVTIHVGSDQLFRNTTRVRPRVSGQRVVYEAGLVKGRPRLELDFAAGTWSYTLDAATLPSRLAGLSSARVDLTLGRVRGTTTLERTERVDPKSASFAFE